MTWSLLSLVSCIIKSIRQLLVVVGAVGYKAQKDLQPVIKQLKASPEDMDSSELKMLRALLMPSQAIGSEIKRRYYY